MKATRGHRAPKAVAWPGSEYSERKGSQQPARVAIIHVVEDDSAGINAGGLQLLVQAARIGIAGKYASAVPATTTDTELSAAQRSKGTQTI